MSESNICGDGLSSYADSSNTAGGTESADELIGNDRIGGLRDMPVAELNDCHDEFDREKYLAIRKAEAAKIDCAVAEVTWVYAQTLDPYGVYELPEECHQIGREYFARNPGSEIWVHFGDLPDPIRDRLWEMHWEALAFPAGLVRYSGKREKRGEIEK